MNKTQIIIASGFVMTPLLILFIVPIPYKGMVMTVDAVKSKSVQGEDAVRFYAGTRYDFSYSYKGNELGETWTVFSHDSQWIVKQGDGFAWILDWRMTRIKREVRFSPMILPKEDPWRPIKVDASYRMSEIPL